VRPSHHEGLAAGLLLRSHGRLERLAQAAVVDALAVGRYKLCLEKQKLETTDITWVKGQAGSKPKAGCFQAMGHNWIRELVQLSHHGHALLRDEREVGLHGAAVLLHFFGFALQGARDALLGGGDIELWFLGRGAGGWRVGGGVCGSVSRGGFGVCRCGCGVWGVGVLGCTLLFVGYCPGGGVGTKNQKSHRSLVCLLQPSTLFILFFSPNNEERVECLFPPSCHTPPRRAATASAALLITASPLDRSLSSPQLRCPSPRRPALTFCPPEKKPYTVPFVHRTIT
jgi:hypothetical protein